MGLGQADLPAAPRVDLGAPRITSPVTSHSVSTKLASVVLTVVLSVVWPPVLPPILPPVVLTLGHQDAHHGQEERLVFSRFIKGGDLPSKSYVYEKASKTRHNISESRVDSI